MTFLILELVVAVLLFASGTALDVQSLAWQIFLAWMYAAFFEGVRDLFYSVSLFATCGLHCFSVESEW